MEGNQLAIADSLNGLGVVYQEQGRYADAEPLYQRCLKIRRAQLGADHQRYAQSLHNLAGLYTSQGLMPKPSRCSLLNVKIQEKQLGAIHLDVAISLNGIADLYLSQDRLDEAEPLFPPLSPDSRN